MPSRDSPAVIVARFLKSNGYFDTLEAFTSEAGLPPDTGTVEPGDLTIEKILEEKKVFDASFRFEKFGEEDDGASGKKKDQAWNAVVPGTPTEVELQAPTNLLHGSIENPSTLLSSPSSPALPSQVLCVTTADRRLRMFSLDQDLEPSSGSADTPPAVWRSLDFIHDSPILSFVSLPLQQGQQKWVSMSSSMSGQVIMYDHSKERVLDERRDHKKYVVKVAAYYDENIRDAGRSTGHIWVATAGWDAKVLLYAISDLEDPRLGSPVGVITLTTNPETILFVTHPDTGSPVLLVTRRDSTKLQYYKIPSLLGNSSSERHEPVTLELLGSQNLAPHANAWVTFSPSSVAISPTDPTLLAVATSTIPHMKMLLVRMLLPPLISPEREEEGHSSSPTQTQTQTRAGVIRDNLAIQDREEAAIQIHVSTSSPQTPFSTPQVVWRPDGTGVWVNGDDGAIRGIEAKTGKIMITMRNGHEAGSKIRSLWCGLVKVHDQAEEWVVSGGFDRKLILWRPDTK